LSPTRKISIKEHPCLVCGKHGVDEAHYPVRRSHGGTMVVPLCRFHHRLLDDHVGEWPAIIAQLADAWIRRMYGEERLKEVHGW